ncbi:MAG: ATP-binding protein [Candidatus Promineifilaceae bacterium]
MSLREELEQAITNLETQRADLGDAAVDAAIAAIKIQLDALTPDPRLERSSLRKQAKQRKQVTVLFADVSEFTNLSETMDAEDVSDTMNALWQRIDTIFVEHGGYIDKHIGDAVMVLWGADHARENDPQQAIRAALAMQAEIDDFCEEQGVKLAMRVGLNTGPVLLGEVGITGEYTAMGDTVNTASRLENAAPVGGILISRFTYQHVRGVFDVLEQEPLTVKGKSEPLQVYIVLREKPHAFRMGTRGVEGLETRTIGRDQELQQLQTAYETAANEKRLTVVTLIGSAGIGKSRLLYEFEQWIELRPEQIRLFKGRAGQQTQGIPHYLLRDTLASRFQILDSDPLAVVRQKFTAGLTGFMGDDEAVAMKAAILGSWLGYDFSHFPEWQRIQTDPEQIRNRAILYLSEYLTAIQDSAVLLFEDIHWADESSLKALNALARRLSNAPILIVCAARPTLYDRRPDWDTSLPNHTRLDLAPLSPDSSQALVEEILRRIDPLPPILLDLVMSRAEGNPFYAEEIIKMLVDNGAILTGEDAWQVVPDKLLILGIPSTLTGVLQARLDRLQLPERSALQQASVIGRIFWDAALTALEPGGALALPLLKNKELIFPRSETAFESTTEYIFKHALLRDVTYETVLKRHRGRYHQLVAEWLVRAATANGRADEYAGLIGEHYLLAQNETLASRWFGRAGKHAASNYAHQEAAHHLTLALALIPESDAAERFMLLLGLEKTNDLQGDRAAQQADLAQLAELAGQLDADRQAQVTLRQANYAEMTSDYEKAIAQAQAAIALAEPEGAWETVAGGYVLWGTALRQLGQYTQAQTMFHKGLASAQKGNLPEQEANCLRGLGVVARAQGDYTTAATCYERALAICREIGDRRGEGHCLINIGVLAHEQGNYAAAASCFEETLVIRREIGDRQGEAICLGNLGQFAYHQGDYATASTYFEQSLTICREVGDRRWEGICLINFGNVAYCQQKYRSAANYYDQGLAICLEIGDQYIAGIALNLLGMLALRQNRLEQAVSHLQQALSIHQELNQAHYLVEDWVGLAEVAFFDGDRSKSEEYLEQILAYLQENPTLVGAEMPMRAFHMTWELLVALEQADQARRVLTLAVQLMQAYFDITSDPKQREMYLDQPHRRALWKAWQEQE